MGRVYLYLKTWAGLRHSQLLCPQLVTSRVHLRINFQWKTVRQDQTWLKEESSSLLVLVGMDDGAGVPAEGGPLAGFCHAFYITSTNSGFYITLSLWDWWWWWWGMIMLMVRRRGPLTGPCQAFYIALPTNFTSYQLDLYTSMATQKAWYEIRWVCKDLGLIKVYQHFKFKSHLHYSRYQYIDINGLSISLCRDI